MSRQKRDLAEMDSIREPWFDGFAAGLSIRWGSSSVNAANVLWTQQRYSRKLGHYSSCRAIQKPSGRAADGAPQQSGDVVAQSLKPQPARRFGHGQRVAMFFNSFMALAGVTVEQAVLLR